MTVDWKFSAKLAAILYIWVALLGAAVGYINTACRDSPVGPMPYVPVPSAPPTLDVPEDLHWICSLTGPNGLRSYTLDIPYMPVVVDGGHEDQVFRRTWLVPFPRRGVMAIRVQSFIGLDRGDIVEADVEISTLEGVRYYLRSVHKEGLATYDAWDSEDVEALRSRGAVITVVGRVNGTNVDPEHKRFGQLNARIHFGVVLIGMEE